MYLEDSRFSKVTGNLKWQHLAIDYDASRCYQVLTNDSVMTNLIIIPIDLSNSRSDIVRYSFMSWIGIRPLKSHTVDLPYRN